MNRDLDWNLYRTFLAVMRTGSLSSAARQLGMTQPSISRHVDMLEAAFGVDLFVRTQRGLDPTDMARELLPHVEALAAATAVLARVASGPAGEVSGAVRVSASDAVGVEILPPILSRLRRAHPQLVVELSLSDDVADLLKREADIALRMVEPKQSALLAKRLPPVRIGLHARRDYLARRGVPATQAQLSAHDLIGYDRETPAMRTLTAQYPMMDRTTFALRTDSSLAQFAAIRAGFGIGMCQVGLAARAGDLVRVLPEVAFDYPLWVVMHEDLKTSARYRAVFDALVAGLTEAFAA
ncbi:MAG TPA: LysR family transcriptional regulator [Rhizomicrobium sp.]|jgi:DNA-binding transcriptional LysR family regulator|nr:LysR family transcriptional regulator [Rhizomicrobium sp.]